MNPKRPTPRHIILKLQKVKNKERILKTAREKQLATDKGAPVTLSEDFSTESLQARGDWQEIIQSDEMQGPITKMALPSKAIVCN